MRTSGWIGEGRTEGGGVGGGGGGGGSLGIEEPSGGMNLDEMTHTGTNSAETGRGKISLLLV